MTIRKSAVISRQRNAEEVLLQEIEMAVDDEFQKNPNRSTAIIRLNSLEDQDGPLPTTGGFYGNLITLFIERGWSFVSILSATIADGSVERYIFLSNTEPAQRAICLAGLNHAISITHEHGDPFIEDRTQNINKKILTVGGSTVLAVIAVFVAVVLWTGFWNPF